MEVTVVFNHGQVFGVWSTQRKALAQIELLERNGVPAEYKTLQLNKGEDDGTQDENGAVQS